MKLLWACAKIAGQPTGGLLVKIHRSRSIVNTWLIGGIPNLALVIVTAALLAPSISHSAGQADPAAADSEKQFYREQFSGWAGIVFRCLPDSPKDKLQSGLCDAARSEARFLAAASKTPFRDTGANSYYTVARAQSELHYGLVLETIITATQGSPRAVYMVLRATSFYSHAIDATAAEGNPEHKPRGGTLVLWERGIIGAGQSVAADNSLRGDMAAGFATLLKDFFSLYLESQS